MRMTRSIFRGVVQTGGGERSRFFPTRAHSLARAVYVARAHRGWTRGTRATRPRGLDGYRRSNPRARRPSGPARRAPAAPTALRSLPSAILPVRRKAPVGAARAGRGGLLPELAAVQVLRLDRVRGEPSGVSRLPRHQERRTVTHSSPFD